MFPPAMSYVAIAREEAAVVERTGLLGEGGAWAGRQVVARFFIEGFGNAEQRTAWLPRLASVAISEPRVGAHPKLLTTRAEEDGDGYCIFGEKAWVSNGPLAEVFIVFAVTAVVEGRKRYSAFLVPRDTPGLSINEAAEYRALAPSRHCGLRLDGCRVPRSAMLGPPGAAYETMALPFRDVEDAVGTFGLARRIPLRSVAACATVQRERRGGAVIGQAGGAGRSIRGNSRSGRRRAGCWRAASLRGRARGTARAGDRHVATGARASRCIRPRRRRRHSSAHSAISTSRCPSRAVRGTARQARLGSELIAAAPALRRCCASPSRTCPC